MTLVKHPKGEMPFLDHLEELRWRIIYSLVSLIACGVLGFWVTLHFDLVALLAKPVLPLLPQHALYFTHPSDKLGITVNIAVTTALVLAAPLIVYQAWLFLAPALRKGEKGIALSVLLGGLMLFLAGAMLAYAVVLPLTLPWMFGFGSATLIPMITAGDYFSFVTGMVLTFGVSFELPIVIVALAALGLVTPRLLTKFRRHAVVLIVIAGALLTPGEMSGTTLALSVPLYLLYELSILLSYLVIRRKTQDMAEPLSVILFLALLSPRRSTLVPSA